MAATITEISIRGYKSIAATERLPLRSLNVLVGANGAGKSSFVGFLALLGQLAGHKLQRAVAVDGGAGALMHLGVNVTRELSADVRLAGCGYQVDLIPTADDRLLVANERLLIAGAGDPVLLPLGGALNAEAYDVDRHLNPIDEALAPSARRVSQTLAEMVAYHFHDTSATALARRRGGINDDERFRSDASNLAAFLHRIRVTHPDHLKQIRDVVRLAAPFFDDFKLRPVPTNPDQIQLEWTQLGTDYPFRPSQLSDGTLRFVCLATALLQPDPPAIMMFDEPELGLHPYALTLLGALLQQAAAGPSQIIVSTQSATLLNEFDAEDVIVVERVNGASAFRRLDPASLTEWLAEYALGDLWRKNVFGGQPVSDAGGPQ